jgi:hypothetical protein
MRRAGIFFCSSIFLIWRNLMSLYCYTLSQSNGVIKTAVDFVTEHSSISLDEIVKNAAYLRSLVAATSFVPKAENAESVWSRDGMRGKQQVVRLEIEASGVDVEAAATELKAAGFGVFR